MSAPTQVSSTATLNALDASLVPSSLSSKLGNLKSLKSALNNNPTLRGQILQLFTYFKRCQAQRANGRTFGRFTVPWDKTIKLNATEGSDLAYYYARFRGTSMGQILVATTSVARKRGLNQEVYIPTGRCRYTIFS
jgi:hypothetical protein